MHSQSKALITVALVVVIIVVTLPALFLFFQGPGDPQPLEPEVRMSYSPSFTQSIGGTIWPQSGQVFLIIRLTVENRGYSNFTANPFKDMYVNLGGRTYDVSASYIFLEDYFGPTDLRNGDVASGQVSFEIPEGTAGFIPGWRLPPSLFIKLAWNAV